MVLDELEAGERPRGRSDSRDDDTNLDDPPADIPDRPTSVQDLAPVFDIPVRVSAVLGKTTMKVSVLTKMGRGAVIELDRKVGEDIDLYLNNRMLARGEVVVVDNNLGVTMTEIIKNQKN